MNKKVSPVPGSTSTEDVFSMELLTEEIIDRRRNRARKAYGVTVLVLAVGIISLPSPNPDVPEVITGFVKVVLLLACCGLVAELKFPKLQAMNYEWLLPSNCDELADLCERNPGLVPYRDLVRSLNRRFTFGEYTAMKSWVVEQRAQAIKADEAARERAGCKRLYGIATD